MGADQTKELAWKAGSVRKSPIRVPFHKSIDEDELSRRRFIKIIGQEILPNYSIFLAKLIVLGFDVGYGIYSRQDTV